MSIELTDYTRYICSFIVYNYIYRNGGDTMNKKFAERIAQLREQKGVSARDMSITLGQSQGYINNIENSKNYPSMSIFFYICEYFEITPKEFFDFENKDPKLSAELINELRKLDYAETKHILEIVKDINKK